MELTGRGLDVATVARFAHVPEPVTVSATALQRVRDSHEQAVRLSAERQVYGRSTGVGANRGVAVVPGDAAAQALLASHATSAGPVRSAERIRATMLVRLNQLCAGGAGVRPEVVTGLVELLNSGELPPVRELSGIGTGDLSALATIALALQDLPSASLRFGIHDALPFLSSNAATLADACLAAEEHHQLARTSMVIAAMVFTVMEGNPEAFAAPVLQATPFSGTRVVCQTLQTLLPRPSTPRRIQDPYGLRAFPQVHGVLVDALATMRATVEAYLNATSENPLVLPDGSIAHHGGFYAGYLAAAADATRSAVAGSAQLSLTRLTYLSEPAHTGLEPFLGNGISGASGVMMGEYVAAAALARLRAAASPAAIQTITLSRTVEDDASFASLAVEQLLNGVADLSVVLAAELLAAVRALRQRSASVASLSPPLGAAFAACEPLPADTADRDLTGDLEIAQRLLAKLAQSVQTSSSDGRSSSA